MNFFSKIPLKTILVVPFLLQIVTAVGLVGYLSYKNGQQAVEDLAKQLMEEVGERISDRIDSYLQTPQQVVATNHLAWQQGTLDVTNLETVRQHIWQQLELNRSVTGFYFLNQKGETVSYGRILSQDMREVARQVSGEDLPIGTIYYLEAKNPTPTQRNFYIADSKGKPQKLLYSAKMNFRTLPWYVQAKVSQTQAWTPVVAYQASPTLGIFAVAPVYDRVGQLQAVFASDVNVADIGTFLKKLNFSRSGQALIIDRAGNLVATSTLEKPYLKQANGRPTPLSIFKSRDVKTREIAQQLTKEWGNFQKLSNPQQLSVISQGKKLFVRVVPYRDKYGLDWLIVMAIPESDFMARIHENTRFTILLSIVILLIAAEISLVTARSIAKPILRLNGAAKKLTKGKFAGDFPLEGAKEVGELTDSFNRMARVLIDYNRTLEAQVKERTEALQRSEAQINAFFSSAPVGMAIVDKQLRFVKVNPGLAEIDGFTVQKQIGKTVREVVPELADQIEPLYQQVLATGQPILNQEINGEVPSLPGVKNYSLVSYFPIFGENNCADGVGAVVVDITDRKQLEIALQEKTNELERFFSVALDLLCIADTDGYFCKLNAEWQNTLGYSLAELEGCRFLDFVHPEDLESTLGAIAELSAQRTILNFTNRYRHRDGSYRWIEWRSVPIGKLIYAAARDITNRKLAEAELLESKRFIEQVTESTSAILYIFDLLEQRNVYINSQVERLLGYSQKEIQEMGSNVFPILMHPEDIPRVIEVHAGLPLLSDNEYLEIEYRMRDKQGEWHWLSSRDRILSRTASGHPAQLLGTAIDITDRKLVEAALRESEHKFSTIFQVSPDPLWIATLSEGRCLNVNESFAKFLEYPYEEIIGKTCVELQLWDNIEDLHYFRQILTNEGKLENFEVVIRTRSGEARTVLMSATVSRLEHQDCVIGLLKDITDRKQMEEALAREILRNKTLLESSVDGIVLMDSQANVIEANASFARMLGYTIEEILTLNVADWDADWTRDEIDNKVAEGNLCINTFETLHRRKDGSIYDVEISANTVIFDGQEVHFCICRDITDRKQIEERLQQTLQQLRFHIENTPLATVIWDSQFRVQQWSKQAEKIFGWTAEEVLGRRMYDWQFIFEEDVEIVNLKALDLLNGKSVICCNRNYRQDGRVIDCEWYNSVLLDESGNLVSILSIAQDVTERNLLERALQASEAKLSDIFNSVNAGIISYRLLADGNFEYEYCSQGCETVFGYTQAELMANKDLWMSRVYPEDRNMITATLDRILGEGSGSCDYRFYHQDGSLRWLSANYTARYDQSIDSWIAIGVSIDITDRKRVEETLRQSENALTTAQKIAHLGNWCFDLLTQEVTWSEEMFRIFGRDPARGEPSYEEVLQQTYPDDLELLQGKIELALSEGKPYEQEIRIVLPDGTVRYTFGKAEVVTDRAGQVVKLFGIVQDISDRKQAEAIIQERETRLKLAMEVSNAIVWERNLQTDELIFTSTTGDGIAPRMSYQEALALVHPDEREKLHLANLEAITEKTGFQIEHRIVAPGQSPEWRWVQVSAKVLTDAAGNCTNAIGMSVDITDRKKIETELSQAKEAAEAANRAKSAFLANMSHELRTPLNAILGFAQLIGQSPTLPVEHRDNIAIINQSGQHLLTLINDVLDMAKIEAGRIFLNEQSFNLHRLLDDLERMFGLKAKEKGLQLIFQRDNAVPEYIRTDEIKLRQVLINLISNGIKFTEAGSISVKVRLSEINSPQILLNWEVKDTGMGIAEDELERIFEPFLQTRTGKQSQEGTGLGLSISRKFVQLMGGEITVKSKVGVGSTFQFDIQVNLVESFTFNREKTNSPNCRPLALAPNQPIYRILIADDRWDNRQLLIKLLSPLGFEVQEATDGLEALKLWESWQPHAILMDIQMPGSDGIEATQNIRAKEEERRKLVNEKSEENIKDLANITNHQLGLHKTKIVAVSASFFAEEKNRLLGIGCDDFLLKPLVNSEIFNILHKHLGVSYLYENIEAESEPRNLAPNMLNNLNFADLPTDLVEKLERATIRANWDEINCTINEIGSIDAEKAEVLQQLVANFDYGNILTAIEVSKNVNK